MFDWIQKEKDLLIKLNNELVDLKIFILGNTAREEIESDKKVSECLQDDLIDNINALDYALKQVDIIKTAMKKHQEFVLSIH